MVSPFQLLQSPSEETAGATPSTIGRTASMTEETAALLHSPPKRYARTFPEVKLNPKCETLAVSALYCVS